MAASEGREEDDGGGDDDNDNGDDGGNSRLISFISLIVLRWRTITRRMMRHFFFHFHVHSWTFFLLCVSITSWHFLNYVQLHHGLICWSSYFCRSTFHSCSILKAITLILSVHNLGRIMKWKLKGFSANGLMLSEIVQLSDKALLLVSVNNRPTCMYGYFHTRLTYRKCVRVSITDWSETFCTVHCSCWHCSSSL